MLLIFYFPGRNVEDQGLCFDLFYHINLLQDSKSDHLSVVSEEETDTLQTAVAEKGPVVIPCVSLKISL